MALAPMTAPRPRAKFRFWHRAEAAYGREGRLPAIRVARVSESRAVEP